MKLKACFSELAEVGDYAFRDVENEVEKQLYFIALCPTGDHFCIPIRKEGEPGAAKCWVWNGNRERPTITPSIFLNPPTGWHGWVTDGVMKTC